MFPICISEEASSWDALPVAKIISFPPDCPVEGRIYGQAQLYYIPTKGLGVRIWSFETEVPKENRLLALHLEGSDQKIYTFSFTPEAIEPISLLSGEDLQGKYWGGEFWISNQILSSRLGFDLPFLPTQKIRGNIQNQNLCNGWLFPKAFDFFEFVLF